MRTTDPTSTDPAMKSRKWTIDSDYRSTKKHGKSPRGIKEFATDDNTKLDNDVDINYREFYEQASTGSVSHNMGGQIGHTPMVSDPNKPLDNTELEIDIDEPDGQTQATIYKPIMIASIAADIQTQ
jgi:hypothetical protein